MAEVRKKQKVDEYTISKKEKDDNVKVIKHSVKSNREDNNTNSFSQKKSLWVKFRIFCHGVKSESKKVHWPSKKDMIKYSVATVVFIIFCSLFFYLIDIIFALIQSIFR